MSKRLRFGGFALDPATGELWKGEAPIDLPPQPMRLLQMLAQRPGRLVTRGEIREEIWGGTVVEFDQAINNLVRQVRDALGDDASDPRFIETVPRRGYRFIAPVEPVEETAPGSTGARDLVGRGGLRRWTPGVIVALGLAIAAALWIGSRDVGSDATVLAVVPARAAVAGSGAEALADALTAALITNLQAVDPERIRVLEWSWDMSYHPEAGAVARAGEPADVEYWVEANVYQEDVLEVSVTLMAVADARQVWYRRFEHPSDDPPGAVDRITRRVAAVVAENLVRPR